jgi:hypothetical protein
LELLEREGSAASGWPRVEPTYERGDRGVRSRLGRLSMSLLMIDGALEETVELERARAVPSFVSGTRLPVSRACGHGVRQMDLEWPQA